MTPLRKLHIGGTARSEGWEVLNVVNEDYVDHCSNANDLSQFADGTFAAIYASHVLEHFDYKDEIQLVLREWFRALAPGGKLYVSVPDLDILCRIYIEKSQLNFNERYQVMRMIFGGHIDEHDYHVIGLDQDLLAFYLKGAGFSQLKRVPEFGIFQDTSTYRFKGILISLNLIAEKAPLST